MTAKLKARVPWLEPGTLTAEAEARQNIDQNHYTRLGAKC